MQADLNGRVAVITGGSKGIGLAIATRMAQSGADVALLARDRATLGRARELANVACFLASDLAGYVTGTAINVDGNMSPVM